MAPIYRLLQTLGYRMYTGMISTPLGDNYESVTVQQLMTGDGKNWDKDLVADIFN